MGLLVLAPAQARQTRQDWSVVSTPERLVTVLLGWFGDLWTGSLRKNGATTDPDGKPLSSSGGGQNGAQTDPSATNDNGMSIDPDG
jgi:hypothetical protein